MDKRAKRFFTYFASVASGGSTPTPPGPYLGTGPYTSPTEETFWDNQVSANGLEGFPSSKTQAILGLYFGSTQHTLNYVVPFKLPYLAPGQTITSAALSFDYLGKSGSPVSAIDVYGMARTSTSATPVPISGDYYVGTNDVSNSRLMQNIITTSTSAGTVTCNNAALVTWLNTQYAAVGAGGTVFVRLNAQGLESQGGFNLGYLVGIPVPASPRSPNTPTLAITTTGALPTDAGKLVFSFTLASNAITSAGVFDTVTGALLRTLWNNVPYSTGINYNEWDGNDDFGTAVAAGTYQIKLMSHNFAPVWEGIVGNTSTTNTGNNVFRSYYPPLGMAIDTATGISYFCTGYSELLPNFVTFSGSAPQTCNFTTLSNNNGNANATFGYVATDGTIVYWAKGAGGVSPALTYVLGMNPAGTAFTTFSSGTTISASPGTQMVTNALDVDSTAGQPNPASGLAVQKTGSYLFVAHNTLNVINVLNKTTGAAVTTIAVTAPGSLACDPTGNLYVVSGTSVLQYTINSGTGAGTLAHTWNGFTSPMAVGCDTGTTLGVVDGGSSQQVKLFNNSTFATITTFGTAGGNDVNGPAINNSAFMFGVRTNSNTDTRTFIAFDASGGFWLGDNGNFRMMHYSVSGSTVTYVEKIAYTTASYVCAVDVNNVTRVFNQYLEYAVDYTKTLDNGVNGSWALVKNWFSGLSNTNYNLSGGGILSPATLSNGRTYGLISNNTTGLIDVVELTATGIRQCGASYGGPGNPVARIHADGSLVLTKSGSTGNSYTPQTKPLTGFDGSGNPIWGTATNLITWTPGTNDPQPFTQTKYPTTSTYVTSNGIVPILDNGITGTGYHLAGIPQGGTATVWRTARTPASGTSYSGRFPSDGGWDIGNSVNYAGNSYKVWGRYIIVGYHGENWGGNQAGRFMVYRDDGLFVGVFGVPGKYYQGTNTFSGSGFAGNASSPFVITNPTTGLATLYVNDESMHCGTHRWSLAGLSTTDLVGTGAVGQRISLN